jgi:hypothetical protein
LKVTNDRFERAVLGLASEAVVNGFPVAVPFGHIPPGCPRTQDPEDAIYDLSVVVVGAAPAFNLWQEVLDTFVLLIGEFIAASRHGRTA